MNLKDCTALVTGGAVRIGKAICERLAENGCGIIVHFNRSSDAAADLVRQLQRRGVKATSVHGRLDTQAECEWIINEAWSRGGGFNILVNNAAVFDRYPLTETTEKRFLDEMRINVMAPILLTRAFAARLIGGRPKPRAELAGKVINLLDRRITSNETGCLPYLLSKRSLYAFTQVAAMELAPAMTVNGVAPGPTLPPATGGKVDWQTPTKDFAGVVPLRRPCTPRDVADAIVYLLQADAVTGQILYVDGGQHLLGTSATRATLRG